MSNKNISASGHRVQERQNPSKTRLETVLSSPARPYPQVVVEGGTYWVDPSPDTDPDTSAPGGHKVEAKFEIDDSARSYRAHFLGYDHQNFTAVDEEFGPVGNLLELETKVHLKVLNPGEGPY